MNHACLLLETSIEFAVKEWKTKRKIYFISFREFVSNINKSQFFSYDFFFFLLLLLCTIRKCWYTKSVVIFLINYSYRYVLDVLDYTCELYTYVCEYGDKYLVRKLDRLMIVNSIESNEIDGRYETYVNPYLFLSQQNSKLVSQLGCSILKAG